MSSIQAQILNLIMDCQERFGLTYMFITHDLSVVEHISTRVAVMYLGTLCELASRDNLYSQPLHPIPAPCSRPSPSSGPRASDTSASRAGAHAHQPAHGLRLPRTRG